MKPDFRHPGHLLDWHFHSQTEPKSLSDHLVRKAQASSTLLTASIAPHSLNASSRLLESSNAARSARQPNANVSTGPCTLQRNAEKAKC